MKYVKHFDIDGVETRQAACIELHGKPNAATEGYVGVLGIDVDSPLHDVYKCVAVNGSIYTWDLLSSGLSIMSATVSGGGAETAQFEYTKLKKPSTYVIKVGDLILDGEGHLYQIDGLNVDYCDATYCGTRLDGQPETDPTVPAWAKQPSKPKYTAEEVGARPNTWTPTADDVGAPVKGTEAPDSTATHIKPVPADSASYAEIVEIGGMTYKDGETLRSAPVTEVESVGVQVWDEEWTNGYYSERTGAFTHSSDVFASKNKFKVKPNTAYSITCNASRRIVFYDINQQFISGMSYNQESVITTPNNCHYMAFSLWSSYGNSYKNDIMINEGTTAQPYTPYTRHTLPIPEAVRNIDGYGWGVNESVYNYIDYKKKQFVKRVGCVDMGTLDFVYEATYNFFAVSMNTRAVGKNFICELYTNISAKTDPEMATVANMTICSNNDSVGKWINIKNTAYTDAVTFKAAMSGVMLYYELATPIITDISDLLPADNIIGVEGGGTVRMVNEYGYDVPSTVVFHTGDNGVIGADSFVGDLLGTASRAMANGEGRPFPEEDKTYTGCFYQMVGGVKEWINPPMDVDTEYRTTERIQGKAVYKKLDSSGKLLMRLDGKTEWVDYVYHATNATNADQDGNGNNIAETYATKVNLSIARTKIAQGQIKTEYNSVVYANIGFRPMFLIVSTSGKVFDFITSDYIFASNGDDANAYNDTWTFNDTGFVAGQEYTSYEGTVYYIAIG